MYRFHLTIPASYPFNEIEKTLVHDSIDTLAWDIVLQCSFGRKGWIYADHWEAPLMVDSLNDKAVVQIPNWGGENLEHSHIVAAVSHTSEIFAQEEMERRIEEEDRIWEAKRERDMW